MPRVSKARNSSGNPGKSESGFPSTPSPSGVAALAEFADAVHERRDGLAASAHQQRRIFDYSAKNRDAVSFEITGEIGRREQNDRLSDLTQRVERAEG